MGMHKHEVRKSIVGVMIVGFAILIVLVWLDDLFDLPSVFGTSTESILLAQTIIVSVLAASLCAWLLIHVSQILSRLQYLESFLTVCSFCKRIHMDDQWIAIEKFISQRTDTKFSHGLCPECKEEHYGDFLRASREAARNKKPEGPSPESGK
jgi:carbon starvation protein CstA